MSKSFASTARPKPETVVIYYRARKASGSDLLKLLQKQWATLTALRLVDAHGHLLFCGKDESGETVYVEIFTWKDATTPDNPPPAVLALWTKMQSLVAARNGHSGVEITGVKAVSVEFKK